MFRQIKIWLVKAVLVINALVLLGTFVGNTYLEQHVPVAETEEANPDEQSTGSASFHLISYEAIVPGFHFYIPIIKEIVFEIESTTPYSLFIDNEEPLRLLNVTKVLFGRIICPNAP